jgi:dienelactone hydrolase
MRQRSVLNEVLSSDSKLVDQMTKNVQRSFSFRSVFRCALLLNLFVALPQSARSDEALPERVTFPSADGQTTLVGYLFKPQLKNQTKAPAVVMMHGRAGAYSSAAKGVYDASTLTRRHKAWGRIWTEQGYYALMVDGFGPRGYPDGFPRFSYDSRPESVSEVTVRPLDAYGALTYLRTRNDIIADHVVLQGWSNGGSATLVTMATAPKADGPAKTSIGFRGAVSFYPACGLKNQFSDGIVPYAPVRVYQGSADEEVSPQRCSDLVAKSKQRGGDIEYIQYPGAGHSFDDPSPSHQDIPANALATSDAIERAKAFFAQIMK